MPKLSIIIPVYNTEKYLKKCLDTCINQTYKDIEIIIVNDGSPDNSESIILEYRKNDSRIKYIQHESNKGLFAARESGVRHASSEYIVHLDSDDWFSEKACEYIIQQMKSTPDLIMHSLIKEGKQYRDVVKSYSEISSNIFDLYTTKKSNQQFFIGLFTFRRDIALKVYDDLKLSERLILAEDVLFISSYLYYTKSWVNTQEVCYHYNVTNIESATRRPITTERSLQDLQFLKVVFNALEKFATLHGLPVDTFNNIKKKNQLDFLYSITPYYRNLNWEKLFPKCLDIFGSLEIADSLFNVRYTPSMPTIYRKILSKIINIQKKY